MPHMLLSSTLTLPWEQQSTLSRRLSIQIKRYECLTFWVEVTAGDILKYFSCLSRHRLDARPTGDQKVAGSTPAKVGNILSWRSDHEIFSTAILSLLLIQKGQLSVSGERMCTILVNSLED